MRTIKITIVFLVYLFSIESNASEVSIISLIASPDKYENKSITVIGVVGVSYEASNIYLDKWSFNHGVISNGVCLSFDISKNYKHFNGVASIISGVFEKNKYCGHVLVVKNIGIAVSAPY